MDRRKFLSGAGATVSASVLEASNKQRITQHVAWKIKGFTCITCAVGLEVMLRGLKGVTEAKASYLENSVFIGFDSRAISEIKIQNFIATCGFSISN